MTSLLTKISTQIRGALHDTADNLEDPGRTARELTRQINDDLQRVEDELVQIHATYNMKIADLDQAKANVTKYDGYALKAVQAGNDALAKEALVKKNQAQSAVDATQKLVDQLKSSVDTLDQRAQELRNRRDAMAQRTDLLVAESAVADATDRTAKVLGGSASNGANAQFEALEAKVHHQTAVANARLTMNDDHSGATLDAQFQALDHPASAIDDQLNELKRRANQS